MPHVLIIDDEPQIRSMLRQMLERIGLRVSDAPDGKAALALQRNDPADLIITDIIMPEKEGLETIIEMKRACPGIKIIAMSGGGRNKPTDYLSLAQKLGAVRTFAKPIAQKDLIAAVQELLP
ncbi:MAG: response regulator [Thermodesulfobacteriota bacterium]